MKLNVLGLDPSFANFGVAICSVDIMTLEVDVLELHLIETERDDCKQVRRTSDDLARARVIVAKLTELSRKASMAMSECTFFSKSANAAKASGICIGVLAGLDIPLIQVKQDESKMLATGKKDASKAEMILWAVKQHPAAPWLYKNTKNGPQLKKDNEHLADAVAAVHVGVRTQQFKEAVALYKGLTPLRIS